MSSSGVYYAAPVRKYSDEKAFSEDYLFQLPGNIILLHVAKEKRIETFFTLQTLFVRDVQY